MVVLIELFHYANMASSHVVKSGALGRLKVDTDGALSDCNNYSQQ